MSPAVLSDIAAIQEPENEPTFESLPDTLEHDIIRFFINLETEAQDQHISFGYFVINLGRQPWIPGRL